MRTLHSLVQPQRLRPLSADTRRGVYEFLAGLGVLPNDLVEQISSFAGLILWSAP